jgi:hypothetical protein
MSRMSVKSLESRSVKTGIIMSSLLLVLFIQGCSSMGEVVWNKAETTIDGHKVVIRPCRDSYRRTKMDTETDSYHIFGCGEKVKIEIRNEMLTINGKSYGTLGRGDSVEVNREKVFINKKEAGAVAMK